MQELNFERFTVCIDEIKEENSALEYRINIERVERGYKIERVVKNLGNDFYISGLCLSLTGLNFDKDSKNDYYYCNENGRLFNTLTLPIDYDRVIGDKELLEKYNRPVDKKWNDPEVINNKICDCPYQPYPAILISNYESNLGLVIGSLSQDVFYHNFELFHEDERIHVKINSGFKSIDYRIIKKDESLKDIIYIGEVDNANDINNMFNGYNSVLRENLKDNCGKRKENRNTILWDSWNDGIYRDVSEKMLIEEAKAVKKYFPNVEWFQLDDGYSKWIESNVDSCAHGLGVFYEENHGIDEKKFPNGLKGYTDKIKEIGLRPAIWVGGFCPVETKIYREHPEWFLDYTYRVDNTQPLDVSKSEPRKYMQKAIEWFIKDCGFEGIKHDFWSYAFEDSHNLLENKDKSGYEHRDWWTRCIRNNIGDGYMETGCDLSMGNPFIGKYFNNYRFGIDVGAGEWYKVLTTTFWSVAILSSHTGDLFVPNSDSIGLLPNLNDTDFMFVINFAIISRTLVEISGRFSKVDKDNARLKVLQKATEYVNNGENVYFANYDYRQAGCNIPKIIYIKSQYNSNKVQENVRTVAIFNGQENEINVSFNVQDLELPQGEYEFTNVWSDEQIKTNTISVALKPHESKLYIVKEKR